MLFQNLINIPDDPTCCATNDAGISVQMIIAETLRLYPPTRRIYMEQDDQRVDAIDIETLHRVGGVWGADPLKFDPVRWVKKDGKGLDVSETEEYMPFGSKGASISR
jgi:cytochrome P450